MPRKSKLTRKLIDKLACHVVNGHTIKTSAALCGLSERSIYNWLELASNDASGRSLYAIFAARMEQAKSEFIDVHLGRVTNASKADPKFSQWLLERKAPQDFGRMKVEHAGKVQHLHQQDNPVTCRVVHPGDSEWIPPGQ